MTNKLPVPTVELPSPSVPVSKNNMLPEAIPMTLSAARHAVQPENRTHPEVIVIAAVVPETEATGQPRGKCSQRNAPHVVKTLKCLLNLVQVGQSTVQIVTAKQTPQNDIR